MKSRPFTSSSVWQMHYVQTITNVDTYYSLCEQIAAWLVGNSLPKSKAIQLLWRQLQAQKSSMCHTEASISNCVIDLATRKSHGVKGGQLPVLPALLNLQLFILSAPDLANGKHKYHITVASSWCIALVCQQAANHTATQLQIHDIACVNVCRATHNFTRMLLAS